MISAVQHHSHDDNADRAGRGTWQERTVTSFGAMMSVIEELASALAVAQFTSKEVFGMRLALEEAGVNAIKHGHQGRQDLRVFIRYRIDADQVLVEVEDEGAGFDPAHVPDPLAPENLERTSGRGLLLMKCYTTWLSYNQRGNCVTLCKQRA